MTELCGVGLSQLIVFSMKILVVVTGISDKTFLTFMDCFAGTSKCMPIFTFLVCEITVTVFLRKLALPFVCTWFTLNRQHRSKTKFIALGTQLNRSQVTQRSGYRNVQCHLVITCVAKALTHGSKGIKKKNSICLQNQNKMHIHMHIHT